LRKYRFLRDPHPSADTHWIVSLRLVLIEDHQALREGFISPPADAGVARG